MSDVLEAMAAGKFRGRTVMGMKQLGRAHDSQATPTEPLHCRSQLRSEVSYLVSGGLGDVHAIQWDA